MATFRSNSSSATTMTVTLSELYHSWATVGMRVNWSVTTGSSTSLGLTSDRTLYVYHNDGTLLGQAVIKDNIEWLSSRTYTGTFDISFDVGTYNAGGWNVYIQTSSEGTSSCIWTNRSYCTDFYMGWSTFYTDVSAPTWVSASPLIAESNITISWGGAGDGVNNPIAGYHIYVRYNDGSGWNSYSLLTGASSPYSWDITGQPRYRTFQFIVYSIHSNYGGNPASPESNTARRNSTPSVPTNPSVSVASVAAGTAIRVSFTPSTDADSNLAGYEVAMQNASGTWYNSAQIMGTGGASATYIDVSTVNWASGNQWKFFVRAYDSLEVRSNWSATSTALVTIGGAPSMPLNVRYNGGIDSFFESPVRVSWSVPANTYGLPYTYEVILGVWNGLTYVFGNAISTGSTAYYDWNISGYDRGQRLYAQVRAVNSVGASGYTGNGIPLYRNRIPSTPTLVFPKSSSTIYNPTPRIGYTYATDADGQSVLGSITLDGVTKDADDSYWSKTGRQTAEVSALCQGWTLDSGNYTVTAKSNDGLINSSTTQRTFTVANPNWTDATITPKVTPVKAAHITELRTAIDNVYDYYGLTKPTWTAISAGVTPIKAIHITEMRQAIEAIRTYVNSFDNGSTSKDISAFIWTDIALVNKRIRAIHITELRQALTQL